jgi:hypothetical protein
MGAEESTGQLRRAERATRDTVVRCRRGPTPTASGLLEAGTIISPQLERFGKQLDRVPVWPLLHLPFQVADASNAQSGALGQLLLRQPG